MKLRLADSLWDCPQSAVRSSPLSYLLPQLVVVVVVVRWSSVHAHWYQISWPLQWAHSRVRVDDRFSGVVVVVVASFHFHTVESHFYSFIVTVSGRTRTHSTVSLQVHIYSVYTVHACVCVPHGRQPLGR